MKLVLRGGGGNSSLVAHENIHENTWKEDFEYSLEFVERYRILLKLLPQAKKYKKVESVLDIGCGKQFLRDVLNEQHIPIQKYIGVDLYQHKKDTIICDLNNESLPNMGNFDLVVCAGVLEYIYDVKGLLKQIFGLEPFYFLCSYNFSNLNRTHNPIWVKNMMTQKEILDYCIEAGYNLFAYESDENKETLQTGYFLFTHKNVWQ